MLNAHAAYITHLLFSYAWSQLTCLAIGVLFSGPGRDIGPVCPCMCVCVCVPGQDMLSSHAAYITHLLFSYAWSQLTCLAIGVLLVLVLVVRVETSVQRVCVCVCVCVSVGDVERARCLHHCLFTVQLRLVTANLPCYWCSLYTHRWRHRQEHTQRNQVTATPHSSQSNCTAVVVWPR